MENRKINYPGQVIILLLELIFLLFVIIRLYDKDLTLALSFCINIILTFEIIRRNINSVTNTIAVNCISIFVLLFFVLAPVIQVENFVDGSRMVNNLPFNFNVAIYTNLQIALFLVIFIFTYFYTGRQEVQKLSYTYSKRAKTILLFITILIFIVFFQTVLNSIFKFETDEDQSVIVNLIVKKSIFMVPVATYALYASAKRKNYLILIIVLLFLLFLKNPLSERRNAIGPLYMAIVFFLFPFLSRSNFKSFIYIFVLFFFLFPISSLITNSYAPVDERVDDIGVFLSEGFGNDYFESYFKTLHYDAWSNIAATTEYVNDKDFSYGGQLLGGLFFFIPRFLWPGKPIGTGHLIANDYLIPRYNLWLSNISCPVISEGYINFGIAGIILFAVILALFVKKIDNLIKMDDPIKKIFGFYSAFWLFYFMRGDLMSSWAYLCGAFIGIIFIPKIIDKILKAKWI